MIERRVDRLPEGQWTPGKLAHVEKQMHNVMVCFFKGRTDIASFESRMSNPEDERFEKTTLAEAKKRLSEKYYLQLLGCGFCGPNRR